MGFTDFLKEPRRYFWEYMLKKWTRPFCVNSDSNVRHHFTLNCMFYFLSFLGPFPPLFLVFHDALYSFLLVRFNFSLHTYPSVQAGPDFCPRMQMFWDFSGNRFGRELGFNFDQHVLLNLVKFVFEVGRKGSTGRWWNIRGHRRELQCGGHHPRSGTNNYKILQVSCLVAPCRAWYKEFYN